MRFVGDVKFGMLATLLRCMKNGQQAEALWRGWKYLCLYNDERLDFGLFFCVRNVEAVEAAMVESLAPGTGGLEVYGRKGVGSVVVTGEEGCCCSTAVSSAACPSSARRLLPAGSMTATGDAVVGAAAAAAAVAANTTSTTTAATAFLPAPLTWRGDWGPYMHRYMEVLYAKFFGPDGALSGAGGMKKCKDQKKTKTSSGGAAALSAAPSVSASSTTTPRRVRAMAAGMVLARRKGEKAAAVSALAGAGAGAGAGAAAGAAAAAPLPVGIQSAPTTPARPPLLLSSPPSSSPSNSSSSSPPSTPPNGPVSPRTVFVASTPPAKVVEGQAVGKNSGKSGVEVR